LDQVQPAWKIISLLLCLGVFLGVGAISLAAGDELVWCVGKATGAFIVSWFVLSHLGALLGMFFERSDDFGVTRNDEEAERRN